MRILVPAGGARRRVHRDENLVGPGEGEVFRRVIRWQDLDPRLVLDPNLDDVKRAAVADKAFPAGAGSYLRDLLRLGRNAEGKMGRPVAALSRLLDEGAADLAIRLELGAGRINLDARPVIVELQGEEASRIGRKRYRPAAHQLG